MTDPLMTDVGREIVTAVLTAILSLTSHRVLRIIKDVNAFFEKQRCHDERLAAIEHKLGLSCKDTCKEGDCK